MAKQIEWPEFPGQACYNIVASDADIELLVSLKPGCDPRNPPWAEIEAELLAAGYHPHDVITERCRKLLLMLRQARAANKSEDVDCYVTLVHMAAIVNRTKKTLQRLYEAGKLPEPAIQGGTGKPHEWKWSDVRPILEHHFSRQLPATFPGDRFVR